MSFKKRYSQRNIRVRGEAAGVDNVAAQSFPDILREIIESGGSNVEDHLKLRPL